MDDLLLKGFEALPDSDIEEGHVIVAGAQAKVRTVEAHLVWRQRSREILADEMRFVIERKGS